MLPLQTEIRVLYSVFWNADARVEILDSGYRIPDIELEILVFKNWALTINSDT